MYMIRSLILKYTFVKLVLNLINLLSLNGQKVEVFPVCWM